ncbi:DUF6382 domain-containing protein [Paenibacillus sp. MMS20-IR301]|uniref:DUF6382 domain-containing protein n=1 Tax=Paenibacillus sp. MMS20-IR301 TaxID=2895946 RepID=UPI0028E9A067|nr:DUF6382 domain-containing protein [Paenibacillus sp. MMS20-IR301]WNS41030.1 DUF6382 domain-containing protein [Paenibacillus sp. MMS20-IR301]
MFGLERDFVQQDGITMLLGKPGGLAAEELNMVQARMLINTGIPHHLRLLLREIDLQVTLEYAVSRRKMLGALLKSERLSMKNFFGLMLQIAAGMEEGRLYMLRTEQYALHEDYIFIEGPLSSGKVFLTYLPLQNTEPAVRPGESLKSLIMVFMAAIHELSGDGMRRLLQYCGEEAFSPGGLKELLAELLTGAENHRPYTEAPEHTPLKRYAGAAVPPAEGKVQEPLPPLIHIPETTAAGMPGRLPFVWDSRVKEPEAAAEAPEQMAWLSGTPLLKRKEAAAAGQPAGVPPGSTQQHTDQPSPYRTYIILGAVLCDALLWKFLYLNNPQTLWLAVSAAATLGLGLLCWMIWSGRLSSGESEEEEAEPEEINGRQSAARRLRGDMEWDFGRNPVVPLRPSAPASQRLGREAEADSEVSAGLAADRQEGNMGFGQSRPQVKEPAATALLVREPGPDTAAAVPRSRTATPYLERINTEEGGAPERIELDRPSFIIGRSSEVAQYIEQSEGASRVHAEISRSSSGYILKDLDSRNGTLLAGEVMVPYKEYPLAEGTVFTIVKGSYTFHTV